MQFATLAVLFLAIVNEVTSTPVLPNSIERKKVDSVSNCPVGYSKPDNSDWTSCYKVYSSFKNKKAAVHQCQADNGVLASVPNAFVNSYLYYLASQNGATSLWLGIECFNGDANTCVNDDGSSFAFDNFYPGQPNVDGNCVYISAIGRDSQKWLSFDCGQKFQFACEVKTGEIINATTTAKSIGTSPTIYTPTRFCPTGYSLFQGVCYKKFDNPGSVGENTRDQQSAQCKEIPGGNLATIANSDVQKFVDSLQCGNKFLRIGLQCPNVSQASDTRSCIWDDGTTFSFNNFATGEPQIGQPSSCVYSYQGQWYNDEPCNLEFECSLCQAPAL